MKFDMLLARFKTEAFLVEPNFAAAALHDVQAVQQSKPSDTHTAVANESVTYQVVQGIAVIAADGPMYKKNLGGMCMSVVSYDQLIEAHIKAEEDPSVSKILYRVDTPGGSVAGLEEFRQHIADSKKDVYAYAENLMASAGMYAFTAAKEVYANESTILGSIGVIVMYQEPKEKTLAIVSSNAPNKFCDIADEKCQSKMKARLDNYEDIFLSKLELAYPGKSRENIIEEFDRGGTIFATEAKKLGYVKDVMPFQALVELLVGDEMLSSEKTANNQLSAENNDKGIVMTQEEYEAKLATANATIEAQTTEIGALTAQVEQLTGATAIAKKAVIVGMEHGAPSEVIVAAMESGSEEGAENAIYKAVMTPGAVTTGEGAVDAGAKEKAVEAAEDEAMMAFAAAHKA